MKVRVLVEIEVGDTARSEIAARDYPASVGRATALGVKQWLVDRLKFDIRTTLADGEDFSVRHLPLGRHS